MNKTDTEAGQGKKGVIYPPSFEQKLGFTSIRDMIRESCLCPLGLAWVNKISFSSDPVEVEENILETEEMRQMLSFEENFPAQDFYDMTGELSRIRIEGSYLEPGELALLRLSLISTDSIINFIRKRGEVKYPRLTELSSAIHIDRQIIKKIEKIIDERANIRDNASPALKKIRADKTARQTVVEKQIQDTFKAASRSGWTPTDSGVSIRDGRLVIPLMARYKRQVGGLIHDESATGQTVYVEPAGIVELNNEIRELEFAERREIIRILIELAGYIRPACDDLIRGYHFLGRIDFLRAKAITAISMNGRLPATRLGHPVIQWRKAVHPLLFISHSKQGRPVISLDITLSEHGRIIIISGPNAGGKSVCLKTTGLVQYMYQCGLLPPVTEDSTFGIFTRIFIDIGDEQSVENDLSTYSSKLLNLKFFIGNLDENSLFLIDEMGTGTDPSLGGPIAEASLERIYETKAYGVVTTHYSNLKLLAGRLPGIENGAMLYDSARLKPLFTLKTGIPGSSFAFEIAKEIGFPEDVLENAARKTGTTQLDFDRQIQNLESEKAEMQKRTTEVKVADEFLHELISKYQKLHDNLKARESEILDKAKEEASALLRDSNRIIEKTIREIRESQAEKEKTKAARKDLSEFTAKVVSSQQSEIPGPKSEVRSPKSPTPPIPPIPPTSPTSPTPPPVRQYQTYLDDLNQKLAHYQLTLDLRGKRAEEALSMLQRYIDDAVLLNMTEVRILHGKGNGILRQITRDYLKSVREVKRCQDAPLESGGSGITIVSFK